MCSWKPPRCHCGTVVIAACASMVVRRAGPDLLATLTVDNRVSGGPPLRRRPRPPPRDGRRASSHRGGVVARACVEATNRTDPDEPCAGEGVAVERSGDRRRASRHRPAAWEDPRCGEQDRLHGAAGQPCAHRVVLGRGGGLDGGVLCPGPRAGSSLDRVHGARRCHPVGTDGRGPESDAAGQDRRRRAVRSAVDRCRWLLRLRAAVSRPVPRPAHPHRGRAG